MSADQSKQYVRPLRVFVGHGTKAEKGFHARMSMPEVLAPGVPATPAHDLVYHGGHTIPDLVFTNFYVDGSAAWKASDIQNIDKALAAAMSDVDLNNVMVQYYSGGKITSKSQPSQVLAGPKPQTVSQGDVENLVKRLFAAGSLDGFDFTSTLFNFMLPSGTILNTDTAPTGGAISAAAEKPVAAKKAIPVEHEDDSTQGLGGYHGSVHVGSGPTDQKIYYAVGVYSETLPDGTVNGIPVFEANPLTKVFQEVELTDKSGTVPVQFQYSDSAHGPEGPRPTPAKFAGQLRAKGAGHAHGGGKRERT